MRLHSCWVTGLLGIVVVIVTALDASMHTGGGSEGCRGREARWRVDAHNGHALIDRLSKNPARQLNNAAQQLKSTGSKSKRAGPEGSSAQSRHAPSRPLATERRALSGAAPE